jgi:hypothetical protein
MNKNLRVYGYVNGKAVYSRDEYIFAARGFGPIENDDELLAYAQKVTSNWYHAGWNRTFTSFYLSDYALSEPYHSLTLTEFERLKVLQKEAITAERVADDAREWRCKETIYWADNSVEKIWIDKDGNTKTELVTGPHGDVC